RHSAEAHDLLTNAERDVLLAAVEPESVRPRPESLEIPLYFLAGMGTEQQRREIARKLDIGPNAETPKVGTTRADREGLPDHHFLEPPLEEFRRAAMRTSEVKEHA